jgi:hypothetical protein
LPKFSHIVAFVLFKAEPRKESFPDMIYLITLKEHMMKLATVLLFGYLFFFPDPWITWAQEQNGIGFARPTISTLERTVGDTVCFTLTARDAQGAVITDWDQTGSSVSVTIRHSFANSDTSKRSWNSDNLAYTFAYLMNNGLRLQQYSDSEFVINQYKFIKGVAEVCLIDTKAERGVYLQVQPSVTFLNQASDSINFNVGLLSRYMVEITPSTTFATQVYYMRPYEVVISPQDRYTNSITTMVPTRVTARFPGEFDASRAGLFAGEIFLNGPTNYLIASRVARPRAKFEMQWLMVYSSSNQNIMGLSPEYEILDHPPAPFDLMSPRNYATLNLNHSTDLQVFTWERAIPNDPYLNIKVARNDPVLYSDTVRYTWFMVDSVSLSRAISFPSDSGGLLTRLTLNHGVLQDLMWRICGLSTIKQYNVAWYVEATDGLYTVRSKPFPCQYVVLNQQGINGTENSGSVLPSSATLAQNYPNPFNPSTTISFQLPHRSYTALTVSDPLGKEVAILYRGVLEAGAHEIPFNAGPLPSGMYTYKLTAEGTVLSKQMMFLK